MKLLHSLLAAGLLLAAAVPSSRAGVSVSVDFFHDNLEPYGDWREVGEYGYCWQPRDVDRDWRPYSDGHWVYTDAGWTWDSEEPYSWAVYHYGRWARVDRVGWVWVPGTEWGPAWVSWRSSAKHVGWAPLPPEASFTRDVGFSSGVDADYDIGPANYSFVEVRNFGAPRLRSVIIEPRENITIVEQTTNITRIRYTNSVVYNEGPQYEVISRESVLPIRRLKLERRQEFDGDPRTVRAEQLRSRVEGDSLRVVAVPFDQKAATAPRKVAAKVEKAEVDRGWKNAGPAPEVARLRAKIKSEPATSAAPPSPAKAEKVAVRPAASPVPPPLAVEKPAQGKMRKGGQPKSSPAVAPAPATVAPPSPEAPLATGTPANPGRQANGARPLNREAGIAPPSPSSADAAHPAIQPRKGAKNAGGAERPPAQTAPEAQPPLRKPEGVEPSSATLPGGAEAPAKRNRSAERALPAAPESRPPPKKAEPPQHAAPVAAQTPPPRPTKEKGQGKGNDKKGMEKPEGAPQ